MHEVPANTFGSRVINQSPCYIVANHCVSNVTSHKSIKSLAKTQASHCIVAKHCTSNITSWVLVMAACELGNADSNADLDAHTGAGGGRETGSCEGAAAEAGAGGGEVRQPGGSAGGQEGPGGRAARRAPGMCAEPGVVDRHLCQDPLLVLGS